MGTKLKARLRRLGHVKRKDEQHTVRKLLEMKLTSWREKRPKRRFMDAVKEDMLVIYANEKDAADRAL